MDQRLRIIAYSDYICPWCYIGLRRIERLQREFPVDVEWHPFELHPETPRAGFDLSARLGGSPRARAYAENIVALAAESELTIRMPRAVANSHLAVEAAEFAREHGGFDRMHAALFAAYFQDGRDVGDAATLGEIARACGIDSEGLPAALADGRYAAEVDRITAAARADEVVSTPTFVFEGGFRLTGAQEYAVFSSVTGRLLEKKLRNRYTNSFESHDIMLATWRFVVTTRSPQRGCRGAVADRGAGFQPASARGTP